MNKDDTTKNKKYDELIIEHSAFFTEVPDSFKNRTPYSPPNIMLLDAIIPGTIVEIFVKNGQKVEVGEKVLILEAMKMRNIITSPVSAKVKNIEVKIGEIVRKGKLLVEFKK